MPDHADAIQIKRVYAKPVTKDGYRVLVERRWPRSVTREGARIDEWLASIAPSGALAEWFGEAPSRWEEFRKRYLIELRDHREEILRLRDRAVPQRMTLLYVARDPRFNHAAVIQEAIATIAKNIAQGPLTEPTRAQDAWQSGMDERLDEALDESFPASDPPAVHPHYPRPEGDPATVGPRGIGEAAPRVEFAEDAISIDAALVAEDLGMTPALVLTNIREGKLTSRCERGTGEDAGHFRLTFFHGRRRVRLVVDEQGTVLDRWATDLPGRPVVPPNPND